MKSSIWPWFLYGLSCSEGHAVDDAVYYITQCPLWESIEVIYLLLVLKIIWTSSEQPLCILEKSTL